MGYPHYRNSKISMELMEPVYLNLFEIVLTPPALLKSWDVLTIENIVKIGGLDVDKVPTVVEQIYKGAKRRYSAAFPDSTTVDLAVDFQVNINDANQAFVYNALRDWTRLIFDPLTGAMKMKKDYVGGPMVVTLVTKVGDVIRQWTFPVVWPTTNIPPMEMDYSSGANIYAISMTFAADYWDDVTQ
jgi:hypothetical protein